MLRLTAVAMLFAATSGALERPTIEEIRRQDWFLNSLYDQAFHLCRLLIAEEGWQVELICRSTRLRYSTTPMTDELLIPLFPTVYAPTPADKEYYDAILNSDIQQGDKVLVIGTGSGSDAWAAWTRCRSTIYTIDINPMAIANTRATADLGGFRVRQALGDIRTIELPEDFGGFDYVLWNMPFLEWGNELESNYYDGDDGSIMERFMELLPSLLSEEGQAIIMNTPAAKRYIHRPFTFRELEAAVYVIQRVDSNPLRCNLEQGSSSESERTARISGNE
jgi:predicted RNA methylase